MKVAIIGGGLAGCALAYVLKCAGVEPVIYEVSDSLASGASGNEIGMYNPRFFAHRTPESDYFVAAYALAVRSFRNFEGGDWEQCGALHLIHDEQRRKRFPQTIKNWRWEPEHMRLVDAEEASRIAGVELGHSALYLPDAGSVSPIKLCTHYAKGVKVHYRQNIEALDDLEEEIKVLACGYGAKSFFDWLPLTQMRGQMSYVKATKKTAKLKSLLSYGGYFIPAGDDDLHAIGATFQRGVDITLPMDEDDRENIAKLAAVCPDLAEGLEVVERRAAIRTAVKGHFPIVGRMPDCDNVYVSTGHGSHGILSSLMGAYVLADMIMGRPLSLSRDTVDALSPLRFFGDELM